MAVAGIVSEQEFPPLLATLLERIDDRLTGREDLELELKKASGTPMQAQRFRRAGLSERLSDDAREAARAWGVSVGIALPDGF